ncbi:hypothetical protein [Methylocystis echinoides]|uniref:Methyltransferase type 11 n=1 Tax=Methylocystis echinoides TaxID=29468 RepID=A0A9W6GYY6_9HYPH|nr:hypothetical protein [Methylocystis echinoides]GLI95683.1 hypothetical protein LMG27198_46750 [Methylocystis echinoides]
MSELEEANAKAAAAYNAAADYFDHPVSPDMVAAARELWRMVRPGGQLAITTWGPDLFEPANGAFWGAIRTERPDLLKGFNPWERISTPAGLREMLG